MEKEKNSETDKNSCRCALCGSAYNLSMYAHRVTGYIVGWVFACKDCGHVLADGNITIAVK